MGSETRRQRAHAVIRKVAFLWLGAALLLLMPGHAWSHAFAPALLELKEWPSGRVDVLWKVALGTSESTAGEAGGSDQALRPGLPAHCQPVTSVQTSHEPGALIERWTVDCGPLGLAGQAIDVVGLAASGRTAVIRHSSPRREQPDSVLLEGEDRRVLAAPAGPRGMQGSRGQVALSYLRLGIEHIALGIDHLLFVLCLMLWVRHPRRIVAAVTAFTVAHSLTLALAIFDLVTLPAPPVEALIACSIVLLAGKVTARPPALPPKERPWRMAFAFGLLHGLGFAGALAEAGVPDEQVGLALFCFNAGVEIGQLVFVAGLLGCGWIFRDGFKLGAARARRALAYAAGSAGAFWFIERVVGFWGNITFN